MMPDSGGVYCAIGLDLGESFDSSIKREGGGECEVYRIVFGDSVVDQGLATLKKLGSRQLCDIECDKGTMYSCVEKLPLYRIVLRV